MVSNVGFEDNPDDDRHQLDQCIDEIKSLQSQLAAIQERVKVLEAALLCLRGWDVLNLPNSDGPWAKRLIAEALKGGEQC